MNNTDTSITCCGMWASVFITVVQCKNILPSGDPHGTVNIASLCTAVVMAQWASSWIAQCYLHMSVHM